MRIDVMSAFENRAASRKWRGWALYRTAAYGGTGPIVERQLLSKKLRWRTLLCQIDLALRTSKILARHRDLEDAIASLERRREARVKERAEAKDSEEDANRRLTTTVQPALTNASAQCAV